MALVESNGKREFEHKIRRVVIGQLEHTLRMQQSRPAVHFFLGQHQERGLSLSPMRKSAFRGLPVL